MVYVLGERAWCHLHACKGLGFSTIEMQATLIPLLCTRFIVLGILRVRLAKTGDITVFPCYMMLVLILK